MANLKQDLDEYLLLQNDQKKSFSIKMPQIKVPELGKMFTRKEPEANSFLKDTANSCCPKLTRLQRIGGFVLCFGIGLLFMTVSVFCIPLLVLRARKFALYHTVGSIFFMMSLCFVTGFCTFFKSMFTMSRGVVPVCYTACMIATLYFALFQQSTILTFLFACIQIGLLVFMFLGAAPGGASALKLCGKLFDFGITASKLSKLQSTTLPV